VEYIYCIYYLADKLKTKAEKWQKYKGPHHTKEGMAHAVAARTLVFKPYSSLPFSPHQPCQLFSYIPCIDKARMRGVHAHISMAGRKNYGGIHLEGSEDAHRSLYKPYLCWQHASPPA